jgi:hypothetical protein
MSKMQTSTVKDTVSTLTLWPDILAGQGLLPGIIHAISLLNAKLFNWQVTKNLFTTENTQRKNFKIKMIFFSVISVISVVNSFRLTQSKPKPLALQATKELSPMGFKCALRLAILVSMSSQSSYTFKAHYPLLYFSLWPPG